MRSFLRAHDADRYLTALFAPKRVRAPLMAVYAFNAELARIPDIVSEPALGEIRLQWWRDVLAHLNAAGSSGAPVADALAQASRAHNLPLHLLMGLIDARSADLDGGGFADLQALRAYLYKRDGAVFALSAAIMGARASGLDRASNAAGFACGLTNLLRGLPRDAAKGRVMLPLSLLAAHRLTPEQMLAGEDSPGLTETVAELAGEGRLALEKAREEVAGLEPRAARCAFAPLALVEPYLRALERPGQRPLHDIADINPLRRFARLWSAARTGRV